MPKTLLKTFYLLVAISCLLHSCAPSEEKLTREDFEYVNRQLSPNGKFYIYDYSKWGPMAWSLETKGTLLLKKNERFALDAGEVIDGEVAAWLSPDTLLVFKQVKENGLLDLAPQGITFKNYDGLVIKTERYLTGGGGSGYLDCDSVEFGKLSITLHGINDEVKTIKYPMGHITTTTYLGMVDKIHVEWYTESNNFTLDKNSETIESNSYTYTLTKKLPSNLFDRPGIYQDYLPYLPKRK